MRKRNLKYAYGKVVVLLLGVTLLCTACGREEDLTGKVNSLEQPTKEETGENAVTDSRSSQEEKGPVRKQEQESAAQEEMATAVDRVADIVLEAEKKAEETEGELQVAMTQADMNTLSGDLYSIWDDALNDIWAILKDYLEEEAMDTLLEKQYSWIAQKESAVKTAGEEYEGGSLAPLAANNLAAKLTRIRVYELAASFGAVAGWDDPAKAAGTYVDRQGTPDIYSELSLTYREDGSYQVTASLYRQISLDGVGRVEESRLVFEDPAWGIKGELFLLNEEVLLIITESAVESVWPGSEHEFKEKLED